VLEASSSLPTLPVRSRKGKGNHSNRAGIEKGTPAATKIQSKQEDLTGQERAFQIFKLKHMVYTGIVQAVGKAQFRGFRLFVKGPEGFYTASNKGDSIAINGVCLTLEEAFEGDVGAFFVMEESRKLTNLATSIPSLSDSSDRGDGDPVFVDNEGKWAEVNIEHSLRVGDSVGGHTVAGHVSGVASIIEIKVKEDQSKDIWFDLSPFRPDLRELVVHKA